MSSIDRQRTTAARSPALDRTAVWRPSISSIFVMSSTATAPGARTRPTRWSRHRIGPTGPRPSGSAAVLWRRRGRWGPRTASTPSGRPRRSRPATAALFPKAVKKITDNLDVLLELYRYPAEHWVHLRTTNPIESTFATVRLRQGVTKGPGSRAAGIAMAFKLIESAQHRWRSVNAPHLVPLVRAGATFEKGKGLHKPNGQSIADKMLFMVAAMAAETERELIHERTMGGLAAAAAQGRYGGAAPNEGGMMAEQRGPVIRLQDGPGAGWQFYSDRPVPRRGLSRRTDAAGRLRIGRRVGELDRRAAQTSARYSGAS
jgi:hypothetical protein